MEKQTTDPSASKSGKKTSAGLFITIILVVIVIVALVLFRHQAVPVIKSLISSVFHKEQVMDTTSAAAKVDSMAIAQQESVVTMTPMPKKYYIIVGSFTMETNADKYVEHLKQKGFDSQKIPRTYKNMHAVSCISFDTQKEALRQLNHYRNKVNARAWVLGY